MSQQFPDTLVDPALSIDGVDWDWMEGFETQTPLTYGKEPAPDESYSTAGAENFMICDKLAIHRRNKTTISSSTAVPSLLSSGSQSGWSSLGKDFLQASTKNADSSTTTSFNLSDQCHPTHFELSADAVPDSKASTAPASSRYPVILKIIHGIDTDNTLLKLTENTKSSIKRQAKEYIATRTLPHKAVLRTWRSHLLSVVLRRVETDVSLYEDDDLTFLLELLAVHAVSRFTVCVSTT
jgi:hypothetical protein